MRILLVEDETEIAQLIQQLLHREKYVVDLAPDLEFAKEAIMSADYPLAILDRRLPDGDGLELIKFAKENGKHSRFLVVSALSEVGELVQGLNLGADDYIVKPFEPDELIARIRAALRRSRPEVNESMHYGAIEFDKRLRSVLINGESVIFGRRELSVIETLMKSAGRVVTRDTIESTVYGYDDLIQSNTLESHISRLRKVLNLKEAGVVIHAIRGVGYIMKET